MISTSLVFGLLGLAAFSAAYPASDSLSYSCSDGSVLSAPSTPIPCNYDQSKRWCENRGMRLATIKTAGKQQCLEYLFNCNNVLKGKSAWLGMRRTIAGDNNSFKWNVDGTPIQNCYTKWGYGLWPNLRSDYAQPDNTGDCVHTWGRFEYTWNDNYCGVNTVWGVDLVPVCENIGAPTSGCSRVGRVLPVPINLAGADGGTGGGTGGGGRFAPAI